MRVGLPMLLLSESLGAAYQDLQGETRISGRRWWVPLAVLSPAAATGGVVCPTSLLLLFPIRMRGPSEPRKGCSPKLWDEEGPCATNRLWKTQRGIARFPLQKNPLATSVESGLLTASAISFFWVASAFQLRSPVPGAVPGECLSQLKSVKSILFLGNPPVND